MQYQVPAVAKLVEQFARLPGIGRKTAQRLTFAIIGMSKDEALAFAEAVKDVKESVRYCKVCQNISDTEVCAICDSPVRDKTTICVVEDAQDVEAFEKTKEYRGLYHVLHGLISPADGIGPDNIRVKELLSRLSGGTVREVIMATNPTIEGEATAMYIARLLSPLGVTVTRLAFGIPIGGELEYADENTLLRAIEGRHEIK
ncbi:MAG: recombination mediator RecR [Bacillota bacterium]|nr:recombination mediator RecR [Bacillota bacterium]